MGRETAGVNGAERAKQKAKEGYTKAHRTTTLKPVSAMEALIPVIVGDSGLISDKFMSVAMMVRGTTACIDRLTDQETDRYSYRNGKQRKKITRRTAPIYYMVIIPI